MVNTKQSKVKNTKAVKNWDIGAMGKWTGPTVGELEFGSPEPF